jgi:hypothetical protein
MRARRKPCSLLVATAVLMIFWGSRQFAMGSPMVDQDFSFTPPSFSAFSLATDTIFAQSFTVGLGGLLTGTDLLVFDATPGGGLGSPPISDMTVQIRALAVGVPTEIALATSIVPATSLKVNPENQFTHVDFPSGVSVTPGHMLALTITGAGGGWSGHVGSQASYSGGDALVQPHAGQLWQPIPDPGGRDVDFLFRTYVDPTSVSEPSTLPLLASAIATLLSAGAIKSVFLRDVLARLP